MQRSLVGSEMCIRDRGHPLRSETVSPPEYACKCICFRFRQRRCFGVSNALLLTSRLSSFTASIRDIFSTCTTQRIQPFILSIRQFVQKLTHRANAAKAFENIKRYRTDTLCITTNKHSIPNPSHSVSLQTHTYYIR